MAIGLRGELHNLIEALPADELHAAQRFLAFLRPPASAADEPKAAVEVQAARPRPDAANEDTLVTALRRGIKAVDHLVDQERDLQRVPGVERSFWKLRVDDAKVLIRLNADGSVRIVTTRPAPELQREPRLECGA